MINFTFVGNAVTNLSFTDSKNEVIAGVNQLGTIEDEKYSN